LQPLPNSDQPANRISNPPTVKLSNLIFSFSVSNTNDLFGVGCCRLAEKDA
jgi:hypothetical protein